MKQDLQYNILLAVTIASCVLVTIYNFVLDDVFATMVEYRMPVMESVSNVGFTGGETLLEYADDEIIEALEAEEPQWYDPGGTGLTSVKFPLEINTATKEEILFIPRVGNVTATRIVQYREVLGGYTGLEQLMQIKNIGEKTYLYLSQYFYIAGDEWDTEQNENALSVSTP